MACFTSIADTVGKKLFVKDKELSTEYAQLIGMLWRRTSGDESKAIKFYRPRR